MTKPRIRDISREPSCEEREERVFGEESASLEGVKSCAVRQTKRQFLSLRPKEIGNCQQARTTKEAADTGSTIDQERKRRGFRED